MQKKLTHHIQKLSFEISYDNAENALIFQQEISTLIKQKLSKLVEETFDKIALKDAILRINTLEIDLGQISYEQMKEKIPRKFQQILRDLIQKILVDAKIYNDTNAELIVPQFALVDVLLLYLQTGVLPWWIESSLAGRKEEKIKGIEDIFKILLKEKPALLKEMYLTNVQDTKVLKRSIAQFSDTSIFALVTLFVNSNFIRLLYTQIIRLNQKITDLGIDSVILRKVFFETVFKEILARNMLNPEGQKQIVEKVLFALIFTSKLPTSKFWEVSYNLIQEDNFDTVLKNVIVQYYEDTQVKDGIYFWQEGKDVLDFKENTAVFRDFSETKMVDVLEKIYPKEARIIQKFVAEFLKYYPKEVIISNLQPQIWEFIIDYLWQQQTHSFLDLDKLFLASLENILERFVAKADREKFIIQIAQKMSVFTMVSEEILAQRREVISETWQEKENLQQLFQTYEESKILETLLDILPKNEVNYLQSFVNNLASLLKSKLRLKDSEKQVVKEIWQKIVDFLWVNRFIKISISALLQNVFKNVLRNYQLTEKYPVYEEVLEEISQSIKELQISLKSFSEEKRELIREIWLDSKNIQDFLTEFAKVLQRDFVLSDLQGLGLEDFYRQLSQQVDITKDVENIVLETLWQDKQMFPDVQTLMQSILPKVKEDIEKEEGDQWKDFDANTWFVQYDEQKVLKLLEEVIPEKYFWLETFTTSLAIYLQENKLSEKSLPTLRKTIWEVVTQYLWQKRFVAFDERLFLENVLAKILEDLSIKDVENRPQVIKEFLQEKINFEEIIREVSLEKLIEDIFAKGILNWKLLNNSFFLQELQTRLQEFFENAENQRQVLALLNQIKWTEELDKRLRLQTLLDIFLDNILPDNLRISLKNLLPNEEHILESIDASKNFQQILEDVDLMIFYLTEYLDNQELPNYIIPPTEDFMLVMIQIIQRLAQKHEAILSQYLQTLNQEKQDILKQFHPTIIGKLLETLPIQAQETITQSNIKVLQELKKMMDDSKRLSKKWMSSEIYIQNAGLVLLSSYLSRYFKFLELTEDKAFKNAEMQERAIFLLQYLASKQNKAEESDLVLNKILVGLPINEPIGNEIQMTQKEIDTSENMLSAVINNWGALGKTSPDNLRASFLLREGKLLNTPKAWKLTVPNNALDILLQRLPWSFKIVRLPWMEKAIEVAWEL